MINIILIASVLDILSLIENQKISEMKDLQLIKEIIIGKEIKNLDAQKIFGHENQNLIIKIK